MSLSPESEVLIAMFKCPQDWTLDGVSSDVKMLHKRGLHVSAYPDSGEPKMFARKDGVYLNIPDREQRSLVMDHFLTCFRAVKTLQTEKKLADGKLLLSNLQVELSIDSPA